MLAQGVGNFMPNDSSQFRVRWLNPFDQAAVNRHLAARHTPGINFVLIDEVDFPIPGAGVRTENTDLIDQALGNGLDPTSLGRIGIQRLLLPSLGQDLSIILGRRLIELGLGHQIGDELFALDTYRPAFRRLHRGTARHGQYQTRRQKAFSFRNTFHAQLQKTNLTRK